MATGSHVPAETTAALRASLDEARAQLVEETKRARGGLRAVHRYSTQLDELLHRIQRCARDLTDTPYALVAVGGYGRRHMCLHSDVDLLIVFDGPITAAEERVVKAVLHPLWDLRLDVGHHVRELADTAQVDEDNPEYLVALLDARFVDGDRDVFDQFANACLRPDGPWREPTLAALRGLVAQRHTQFSHTLFHLEPDIKDSPGGLRDVCAVRTLERLSGRVHRTEIGGDRLAEAEDFMLRIRSVLHLERGRNLNTLTHELQEPVAAAFGSPGAQPSEQVEALMSTYFHHARIISRSLTTTVQSLGAGSADEGTPVGDDGDLIQRNGEISFADGTQASLRPTDWLKAFETALDQECRVSAQVQTCIERHGGRYAPERFFPSSDDRDRLLRVFRPRPGLYDRLSQMHDSGLLGRLFPEFQKVYCHVIRDFYHKYTVDEHTLRTIRNLESLCTPDTRSRERFGSLLSELMRPELLSLALLFHDVGKWTNLNHSEEGVRMALPALRRVGLEESDISTIEFLIRFHLNMSTAAFRRDSDDPQAVHQLARLVGTEERLKLLTLLTLVDVEAVGPGVMTPWKEELLWRLYVDTYNRLTLGHGDDVIETDGGSLASLIEQRPRDLDTAELEAFVDGLPQRYLRAGSPSRVYQHLELARGIGPEEVRCSLNQRDGFWELAVASVDQPKLYAKICGVLSYFGMDILRGQAMSNAQGLALDIFEFVDTDGFLRLNTSSEEELQARLQDVVGGREDVDQMLDPKKRGLGRRGKPRVRLVVHLDNEYSDRFSIFEIVAQDAWGLLYRISRVISQHECDIDLVLASTESDRAVDVFHVTRKGAKLGTDEATALQTDLKTALGDGAETDQT